MYRKENGSRLYLGEGYAQSKIDKNGEGHCFTCMGCRSFLTPYVDENGKPKYYGRFNQGVVTVNLIDIGLSAGKDLDKFWKIFDERMELCHRALQCRHERLTGTLSDAAPILWQYGALARLKRVRRLTSFSMAVIQRFHSVMQVFGSAFTALSAKSSQKRGQRTRS